MNVGMNIHHIRESKELTQAMLAQQVGISQAMMCQIERGTKSLSFPLSVEIAKAL